MSEAAIAEPQVNPEAQDAPIEPPQAEEGTGAQAESQPEETKADELEADPEVAERIQNAIKAGVDAERDKLREEITQDVLTKTTSQLRQDEAHAAVENATQLYGRTAADIRTRLEASEIEDAYGNKLKLNPAQVTEALKGLDAYNGRVLQAARQEALLYVEDSVFRVLPDAAHADFAKDAHGKPLEDYLHAVIQHGASDSKRAKGLTLERALELSPKFKADIEALKTTEFAAGRKKGRTDPVGEALEGQEKSIAIVTELTKESAETMSLKQLRDLRARQRSAG